MEGKFFQNNFVLRYTVTNCAFLSGNVGFNLNNLNTFHIVWNNNNITVTLTLTF